MQKKEGIYNAPKELGWGKTIVLGVQHVFAMFGATVLVPLITGLSVQVTLVCAGAGTLLFYFLTKRKVPAFLGSSFAFLAGYGAVTAMETGIFSGMPVEEKLQYAGGGVVVAGLVYLLVSLLITVVGVKRVMKFVPPIVTGPIIILIGLILAPVAVSSASSNWLLAVITMAIIIVCNIWAKGMMKIVPILMGILIPSIGFLLFNMIKAMTAGTSAEFFAGINEVLTADKVVGLPPFKLAKFDISAILIMAPIALATMMEHVGDVAAIGATIGKPLQKDPGLNRTLLGDGLATALAGLFGGPANTTYGENTGVLALSRVFDPIVMVIASIAAIILGFSPVFANIVKAIPGAVIGGASFILYGMISAIGIRNVVENRIDLTRSRNLIIAAVILVSGLGFNAMPIEFSIGSAHLSFGGLSCAAIFGIVLNAILPGKDEVDEEAQPEFFEYREDEATIEKRLEKKSKKR